MADLIPSRVMKSLKVCLAGPEDTRKLTDWDEGSRVRPQSPDYWAWSCWCGVDDLGYPLWVVPTLSATLMYTDPLLVLFLISVGKCVSYLVCERWKPKYAEALHLP